MQFLCYNEIHKILIKSKNSNFIIYILLRNNDFSLVGENQRHV